MIRLRQLAALTLTLAVAATAAARNARAAKLAGHVEPGVLVARGFPEIHTKATLGGDVTAWWSPTRHFDLGLESGLAVTFFPYSGNDGEPVLGKQGVDGPLHDELTLLPRMMFGSRLRLPADTSIGLFVGATHVVSGALGNFSVIPYPTGSLGVETRFGDGGRYGVRAAFSYMHYWFGDRAFMTSTLAFAWGS